MSNLPIDELRQDDDFDRNPAGSYWTPPVPVSIHELPPAVRAAVSLAISSRSESIDQFEIHLAYAFDMDTCAPAGSFVVATGVAGGQACGIYSDGENSGAKEAVWFTFDGDTDYAFKSLYDRAKEEGYLA